MSDQHVTVHVDLTDSTLGPEWRSVDVECDWPETRSAYELRRLAADHYGVPLAQVGPVEPVSKLRGLFTPTEPPYAGEPLDEDLPHGLGAVHRGVER